MRKVAVILVVVVLFALSVVRSSAKTATLESPILTYKISIPVVMMNPDMKRGVSVRSPAECYLIDLTQAHWFYDWGNDWCSSNKVYMDMMYTYPYPPWYGSTGNWGTYLAGPNEPNLCGQANIDPYLGAAIWRMIEVENPDKILIAPVPSQPVPSWVCQTWEGGFEWLWKMAEVYESTYGTKPKFDRIAVHYYGSQIGDLATYVSGIRQQALNHGYDVKLWVTEFGTAYGDVTFKKAWMRSAIDWMRQQDYIESYAWYSLRVPENSSMNLFDETGNLTALGVEYFK